MFHSLALDGRIIDDEREKLKKKKNKKKGPPFHNHPKKKSHPSLMLNPRLIRKKRKWIKNYTHIYIYTNEFEPRERSISLSAALNYSLARG